MTPAYTDWPLLLKRLKALKHTLFSSPHSILGEKKLAYTTCCVIYNAVVIHSQLTFRGHCKSCVFSVNAFLSSARTATFWRPSWNCSKGSDPGYWFPAWLLPAREVGSPALKKHPKNLYLIWYCVEILNLLVSLWRENIYVILKVGFDRFWYYLDVSDERQGAAKKLVRQLEHPDE